MSRLRKKYLYISYFASLYIQFSKSMWKSIHCKKNIMCTWKGSCDIKKNHLSSKKCSVCRKKCLLVLQENVQLYTHKKLTDHTYEINIYALFFNNIYFPKKLVYRNVVHISQMDVKILKNNFSTGRKIIFDVSHKKYACDLPKNNRKIR